MADRCQREQIAVAGKMTGTLTKTPTSAIVESTRGWKFPLPSKFVSAIVLLILLALLLPEKVFEYAQLGEQECFAPDLITGLIHLKKKTITWKIEGYSRGSTNSLGFLDYEHELAKPPGVFRIAMVGDSLTESLQVPQQSRFSNLLEHRLNESGTAKFEVFNFGVGASGTGQQLLNYLRYAEPFSPDLTILFFDCNDQFKNVRDTIFLPWRPHVVFGVEGDRLTAKWGDFDSWTHSCTAIPIICFESQRRTSHVWGILLQAIHRFVEQPISTNACNYFHHPMLLKPIQDFLVWLLPVERFGAPEFRQSQAAIQVIRSDFCSKFDIVCADKKDAPLKRFNLKDFQSYPSSQNESEAVKRNKPNQLEEETREAWNVTIAILNRLSAECRRKGSKLVIVGMPSPKEAEEEIVHQFNQLKSLDDGRHTYVVNLTQSFNEAVKARNIAPRIRYHFSVAGHQLIADLLLDCFRQKRLLQ